MKKLLGLFLALALALPIEAKRVRGVHKQRVTPSEAVTGLDFPSNGTAGSAIRIVFSGSNKPSRTTKTVLWEVKYTAQNGYYAWAWDSYGDNTWHSGDYEIGSHPFPCDGTFNSGDGSASNGTGDAGSVHYFENAGAGAANDWIATPGGSAYQVTKGTWLRQGFTDEIVNITGTDYVRRSFYVDLSDVSKVIVRTQLKSALDATSPSTPQFSFGSSEWRDNQTGAGRTDEASSGIYRKLQIYSDKKSTANMVSALACETNACVTALALSNTWYLNCNPSPSDVSDKSSAGHNPSWANANRPASYAP